MKILSNTDEYSLYLVDASGFIFRAFHALPPLTNPQGVPIGAVYGFLSMLLRVLNEHRPKKLGIVFDVARKTFRQDLDPQYKANRLAPPPDLIPQFALVRAACTALGLPILEYEGFEADDVLATYAQEATRAGGTVTLVSSDKDLMQLISPHVRMWDPIKNKALFEADVLEKFGVPPAQVAEVQALMGDSSDNVPGVPGIGIKTASSLIAEFHSLENLYARLAEIPQAKRRELLAANQDKAFLSRDLVRLATHVPLMVPLDDLDFRGITLEPARAFLAENGFMSLASRLPKGGAATPHLENKEEKSFSELPPPLPKVRTDEAIDPASLRAVTPPGDPLSYTRIQNLPTLQNWIHEAHRQGFIALELETTLASPMNAEIVGVALALSAGQAAYIPVQHEGSPPHLTWEAVLGLLGPLLADPAVLKMGHNLKDTDTLLERYGVRLTPTDDIMLMSAILYGGKHAHTLIYLAQEHLNHTLITSQELMGEGKKAISFANVDLEQACAYASANADMILRLWLLLRKEIRQQRLVYLYETVERPLGSVVSAMERAGIRVDAAILQQLSLLFENRLKELAKDIYILAKGEFNIASPKQLGDVLFERLALPGGKKGKSGAFGTASDVLESLAAQGHDIARQVLEWRGIAKLKNTYTDTLPQQIDPITGRLHTCFIMGGTSTGRLASTEPNLQNIPIRSEEGRAIRRAFVPAVGNVMASFDYSQIELRLLAHMGRVEPLIQAFQQGLDIHQQTASQVFDVPLDAVDRTMRRKAKMINFGIIYGISAYGLGERLGISPKEASQHIEAYFIHYPGIKDYMERMKEVARHQGYVETLWGRRCYVPGINDRNAMVRQAAERQAINAPLQGTAADLIKRAMIDIHRFLQEANTSVRLILQIHDELLFEGTEADVQRLSPILQKKMTNVMTLTVPLLVECGIGTNWDAVH